MLRHGLTRAVRDGARFWVLPKWAASLAMQGRLAKKSDKKRAPKGSFMSSF
jgi:hypothetical protein